MRVRRGRKAPEIQTSGSFVLLRGLPVVRHPRNRRLRMIRRLISVVAGVALALSLMSATAFAGGGNPSPTGTGQPSTSCDAFQPGPPGFNSPGFTGTAELVYANPADTGSQGGISSGNNPHVVSQYDVACEGYSTHH